MSASVSLSPSTTRHPATQGPSFRLFNNLRQHSGPQFRKSLRIAEEASHADEHVIREVLAFCGIFRKNATPWPDLREARQNPLLQCGE